MPRFGIGIDTGGTYTDSAIVELESGAVVSKAKALTTRHDLGIGIEESLGGLDEGLFGAVELVSLSTTLATNSIVEGKGSRVGLVLAVPNPHTFALPKDIPVDAAVVVAGGHDNRGEVARELDVDAAADAVERMTGEVDSFAVSSYFSIYNAEHELRLKGIIGDLCDLPVVCGHELSGHVGLVERATTAALNAKLLPAIGELLAAVKKILAKKSIRAPLMVVAGDGSVMREEVARKRPVETVLSGPAASVVGACRLTGLADAIVVDMGGTTTDVGIVKDGNVATSPEGALVGGCQTRVLAADLWTVGLGGDSKVAVDETGRVTIGPRRAIPLCAATMLDASLPDALRELEALQLKPRVDVGLEFFTLMRRPAFELSKGERALLDLLAGRVLHRAGIEEVVGPFISVDRFVELGVLGEVSLTPTDVLHATGELEIWPAATSREGAAFLARRAGLSLEELLGLVHAEVIELLKLNIVAKVLLEQEGIERVWSGRHLDFLGYLLKLNGQSSLSAHLGLSLPIVAVGAPVEAYFPRVARELEARLVIPEHSEVANAVGAVTGRIIERAEAVVRPERPDGFSVITAEMRRTHDTLDEALASADDYVRSSAFRRATESGGTEIAVSVAKDEREAPLSAGWGDAVLVEIRLTATAVGTPGRANDLKRNRS